MSPSLTTPLSPEQTPLNGNATDSKNGELRLWKIEKLPGKGFGLVASVSIAPGTQILSERPLLRTDVVESMETLERDLARALRSLPKASQRAYLSLHNNYRGEGKPLSNIVRSNSCPLGPGSQVGGVFEVISRINHSCRPNAVQSWNTLQGEEKAYAIREIKQGEEITFSYLEGGPSAVRKKTLKQDFFFDCTCEICSLPAAQLRASDDRFIRAQNLDKAIGNAEIVRISPTKVLKNCKILLGIFEEEEVKDDRLSSLWYDCFQICMMHGDQARASVFAGRYCDTKKISAGDQSDDFLGMLPFAKNPEKHRQFAMLSKNWKSDINDIPTGLENEEFEKWLWTEKV